MLGTTDSLGLLALWLLVGIPCAAIGGLIAPRKGVEPRLAMAACFVTTFVGVLYLISMPELER